MDAPCNDTALLEETVSQSIDIFLATINARYIHASFGLRYLYANLGELQASTRLVEWSIQQATNVCLAEILEASPKILGLGVYIWNIEQTTRLVASLKQLRPDIFVILGGPEVSHSLDGLAIVEDADLVIQGEADLAFPAICRDILEGRLPESNRVAAPLPSVAHIASPYAYYTDDDIANRVIYVEMSRGCPFKCEFCLSSLPMPVRQFDIDAFLEDMGSLLARGVKQFKFVDRTFNLNLRVSQRILDFFYERYEPGLFLHFEMVPDRFPGALRESVKRFPPGSLQFEVGIQTFSEEVAARISRRQKNEKIDDNLRFLRDETGVHIHADLIAGLPGEDLDSFASGFDRLLSLAPQEIQLGVLKRLRGTPIIRHDEPWGMVYSPHPPYEIMQTDAIDFFSMQRLIRVTKFWDKYGNSGNFHSTLPLLWSTVCEGADGCEELEQRDSPFWAFWAFSDWLFAQVRKTHGLSLQSLMSYLFQYLTAGPHVATAPGLVARRMLSDYQRIARPGVPAFLKPHLGTQRDAPKESTASSGLPSRQARHLER